MIKPFHCLSGIQWQPQENVCVIGIVSLPTRNLHSRRPEASSGELSQGPTLARPPERGILEGPLGPRDLQHMLDTFHGIPFSDIQGLTWGRTWITETLLPNKEDTQQRRWEEPVMQLASRGDFKEGQGTRKGGS